MPTDLRNKKLTLDPAIDTLFIKQVGEQIDGFSPRTINDMIADMHTASYSANNCLSHALFERIVNEKIAQNKQESAWAK